MRHDLLPHQLALLVGRVTPMPAQRERMVTFSGGSGASSSSRAGRNLHEGQGRVTSLTTMTAVRAVAASADRRGAPMGSARARLISARSSAGDGSATRAASATGRVIAVGRRPGRSGEHDLLQVLLGQLEGKLAVAVGDRELHGRRRQPNRAAASLSASTTGIGAPLRNCTMAPPAVQT